MLHRVLLRLSLCFAILLFGGITGLHLYKKDLTLFLLNNSINKILPDTTFDVMDIEISLPCKITLRRLTLTQQHHLLFKTAKMSIAINPMTTLGFAPSSGKSIFCLDDISLSGVELFTPHLQPSNPPPSHTNKAPKKLFDSFPKIGIRHIAIDGILNNEYCFEGEGEYFYDASNISFSLRKKDDPGIFTGKLHARKGTDATLQTSINDYNIKVFFDLEDLWKGNNVPFSSAIEDVHFSGNISKEQDGYGLLVHYEAEASEKKVNPVLNLLKDATVNILWDAKNQHITLKQLEGTAISPPASPNPSPLKFYLEQPATFDLLEKRLLDNACFHIEGTTWTLSKIEMGDTLKGDLTVSGILSQFLPKIFPGNSFLKDLEGGMTITASLSGSPENPTVTCRITPQDIYHRSHKDIIFSKTPITLTYHNNIYAIEGNFSPIKDIKIGLKGKLSQEKVDTMLEMSLHILSNLSTLKPILPEKEDIRGLFEGKMTLKGPLTQLTVSGEGSIKKGLYGNHAVGTHIHPIEGQWILRDDKVTLSLHGKDDFKGTVSGKGSIVLPWVNDLLKGQTPRFTPIARGRVDLFLKEFFIGQSDLFTAKAEGNLFLDLEHMLIGGKIFLAPTIVDLDQITPSPTPKIALRSAQLKSDVLLGRDPKDDSELSTTQKQYDESHSPDGLFRFDIEAHLKKPVIVRGFGIESTWDGKLCLKNFAPDFLGEFKIRQGTIDITERILNFTKGKIVFDGKIKNPYLDLEITKKIDGYDVFVRFKGRAKDPRFTFISSPALSEEEVIALILFGRKSAVTSLGQLFDISSSLSSLSSAGQKKNFFTTFRQTLGIDALELKPQNETSPSKSPQALSIRKRLTDDVDLVLEQTFNDSEESSKSSKASIEKKIDDQWSIAVDASTDKSGSIGLNWVKRY